MTSSSSLLCWKNGPRSCATRMLHGSTQIGRGGLRRNLDHETWRRHRANHCCVLQGAMGVEEHDFFKQLSMLEKWATELRYTDATRINTDRKRRLAEEPRS